MDNVSSFVVHNTGGSWATANDDWIGGLYADTATVSNTGSAANYWRTTTTSEDFYPYRNFKINLDEVARMILAADEANDVASEDVEETWCEEYKDDPDYIEQFLSEFALAVAGGESA